MKNDILWNSVGTTAWSFLSLFLLIIVTRLNGIVDSGLFSFAFAVAVIMYTVACYGGRAYQVSDYKNSFTADNYISLRLITSLAVLVVTAIFILANGYDWYKSILIFLLVGQRIFDAIADVFYGIMQKNNHLHISGKSLFYKSCLSLICFLFVDLATNDLLLAALTLPIISLLFVLLYDIPKSKNMTSFSIKLKVNGSNKIIKSTFLPFIIAVMGLIFVNLARYFIDIYHPDLQGYFGIIIMPLSLTILLFSFISTPALLHLSEKYNDRDYKGLNRSIGKIIGILIIITLLICLFMFFYGAAILHILFNLDFSAYTIDIVLVALTGLMVSLTSLFTNIAVIARRLRLTVIVYLFSIVFIISLCIILVEQYQIRGAIVGYIISSTTQALVMGIYYRYLTSQNQRLSKKS